MTGAHQLSVLKSESYSGSQFSNVSNLTQIWHKETVLFLRVMYNLLIKWWLRVDSNYRPHHYE